MVFYTDLYNNSLLYDKCISQLVSKDNETKGNVGTATLVGKEGDTKDLGDKQLEAYTLIMSQALTDYYKSNSSSNKTEDDIKSDLDRIHNEILKRVSNATDINDKFTVTVTNLKTYKYSNLIYNGVNCEYKYVDLKKLLNANFTEAYQMAERSQGSVLYRCMKSSKDDSDYVSGSVPIFICPSVQDVQITQANRWVSLSDTFSGALTRGIVDAGNNIKDIYNSLNNIKSTLVNAISGINKNLGEKIDSALNTISSYAPRNLGSIEFNAREEFQKYEGTELDIPNLTLNGYALDDTGSGNVLKLIKFLTMNTIGKVKPNSTLGYYSASSSNGIITQLANVFGELCKNAGVGSYEPPPGYVSPYELAAGKPTADIPFSYNVQLTPWYRMTNLLIESITYNIPNICVMGTDGNRYPMLAFISITLKKGRKIFTEDLDKYYNTTYDTYWR